MLSCSVMRKHAGSDKTKNFDTPNCFRLDNCEQNQEEYRLRHTFKCLQPLLESIELGHLGLYLLLHLPAYTQ